MNLVEGLRKEVSRMECLAFKLVLCAELLGAVFVAIYPNSDKRIVLGIGLCSFYILMGIGLWLEARHCEKQTASNRA